MSKRLLPFFILALVIIPFSCSPPAEGSGKVAAGESPFVVTVDGRMPADSMGLTLVHEHVFLDWSPVDSLHPESWDNDAAFAHILPFLLEAREHGVRTVLECTPDYLGRNPALLKRLAKASGLQLLTNTGYYGARNDRHIPAHAYDDSPGELARRWISESENGISGSGVFPGFIKIGLDGDSTLSPIDEKLVRAAELTHLATGLTIVAHTGPEWAILEEMGVAPEAWVWTHAQNGTSPAHLELAGKGAWISLDGLGWVAPEENGGDSTALLKYIDMISALKNNGLLQRTLLSHDAGWYTHGEAGGGDFYKPYSAIFTLLLPELGQRGFTEADFRQLLVANPREAFTVRVRKR